MPITWGLRASIRVVGNGFSSVPNEAPKPRSRKNAICSISNAQLHARHRSIELEVPSLLAVLVSKPIRRCTVLAYPHLPVSSHQLSSPCGRTVPANQRFAALADYGAWIAFGKMMVGQVPNASAIACFLHRVTIPHAKTKSPRG